MTDCSDPDCASGPICSPICHCHTNVNDYGGAQPMAFPDLVAIADCTKGDCGGCVRDCDVNCDGTVDGADLGAAVCHFQAGTGSGGECCVVPSEGLHRSSALSGPDQLDELVTDPQNGFRPGHPSQERRRTRAASAAR